MSSKYPWTASFEAIDDEFSDSESANKAIRETPGISMADDLEDWDENIQMGTGTIWLDLPPGIEVFQVVIGHFRIRVED